MYTLIGTASLNKPNPQVYLRYVLKHIGDLSIKPTGDLFPWRANNARDVEKPSD